MAVTVELRGGGDAQLRAIVAEGFPKLLLALSQHERTLPRHVEREFRSYLGCGDVAAGFTWLECRDCHHHRLVLFSCKTRGFCPSCGGRRMAERAAHLVDRVTPHVATRQWVLTVPWKRRWLLARRAPLTDGVLRVALRAGAASCPTTRRWAQTYAPPHGGRGLARGVDHFQNLAALDRPTSASGRRRRPGGPRAGVDGAGGGTAPDPLFYPPIVVFLPSVARATRPEADVRSRGVPSAAPFKFPRPSMIEMRSGGGGTVCSAAFEIACAKAAPPRSRRVYPHRPRGAGAPRGGCGGGPGVILGEGESVAPLNPSWGTIWAMR